MEYVCILSPNPLTNADQLIVCRQVFGRRSGVAPSSARSVTSSVSRMAEQRRARETAAA